MTDIIEYTKDDQLINTFAEFTKLTIYGTVEDPLFIGNQVRDMLQLVQIRYIDYDEGDDYVKMKILSGGQMREQVMFTEEGFYNIIFKNRSELGKKFRKFVTIIMKELRTKGSVTLSDALDKLSKLTLQVDKLAVTNKMLDDTCEDLHYKNIELERDNLKLKGDRSSFKHQLSLAGLSTKDRKLQTLADKLWGNMSKKYMTHWFFVNLDEIEPEKTEVSRWKIDTVRGDDYSFKVPMYNDLTLLEVQTYLYNLKNKGDSFNKYHGSELGLTKAIEQMLAFKH